MKGRKSIAVISLLLMAGALSSCSRIDLFGKLKSGGGATVTPRNGQWVASEGVNSAIVIQYDSSMDTTLDPSLGGDMGTGRTKGADIVVLWTAGNTLTLEPIAGYPWPTGDGKTLTVSSQNTDGTMITRNYSFRVTGSLRYVSTLGSSGNAGTRVDPIDTVNGAISSITGTSGPYPGVVLVAAGDYTNAGPVINLDFEISIYGGWATDWSEEDPKKYNSKLTNSMTSTTNSVIEIYSGVGNAQVLSGFTVAITPSAATASATYNGILIDTAPLTIRNMVITSTDITDASGITTQGIHVSNGSNATIHDNTISLGAFNRGAVGSDNCINNGILITGSSPTIYNMTISTADSKDGTSLTSRGLYYYNSGNGTIYNSTITMGNHTDASGASTACRNQGIATDNTSSPEIYGNYIHAGTSIMSDTSGLTYGLMVTGNSNPSIHDNPEISGGQASGKTYGIYIADTYTEGIKNNTIFGGKNSPISYGIIVQNSGCSPLIIDNTIDGGDNQGAGGSSSGILTASSSSPRIEHNEISITSGNFAWCIEVLSNASPVITRNLINPGSNAASSYGIRIENIGSIIAEVHNNVILGGGGSSSSYGLYVVSSSTYIRNNTINGGSGGTAYAIWLNMNGPTPEVVNIENNLIFTDKLSNSFGIYENATYSSDPNFLAYNNFYHCEYGYMDRAGGNVDPGDMNNISLIQGSNAVEYNYNEDLYNVLDSGAEYQIKTGLNYADYSYTSLGMNGTAWGFDEDFDGNTRTDPWSIGAHQYP